MRLIDADAIPWTDLNGDNPNSDLKVLITFADKVNRMPTIEQPHWIPCSDRPPEEEGMYLVTFDESCIMPDEGQVSEACWLDDQWQYEVLESSFVIEPIEDLKVTAWMPLPPSYKGDEK